MIVSDCPDTVITNSIFAANGALRGEIPAPGSGFFHALHTIICHISLAWLTLPCDGESVALLSALMLIWTLQSRPERP